MWGELPLIEKLRLKLLLSPKELTTYPDWAPPVTVSTKHFAIWLARGVCHRMKLYHIFSIFTGAFQAEYKRIIFSLLWKFKRKDSEMFS